MRDYIFRGKTRYGEWVYGSLIHVGEYCCILEEDDGTDYDYPYLDSYLGIIDGNATPVIPDTVGQWTGVLDKNGKRVFEGDIVKYEWGPDEIIRMLVYFNNGEFLMKPMDKSLTHEYWDIRISEESNYIEVVDNVHDILKGDSK